MVEHKCGKCCCCAKKKGDKAKKAKKGEPKRKAAAVPVTATALMGQVRRSPPFLFGDNPRGEEQRFPVAAATAAPAVTTKVTQETQTNKPKIAKKPAVDERKIMKVAAASFMKRRQEELKQEERMKREELKRRLNEEKVEQEKKAKEMRAEMKKSEEVLPKGQTRIETFFKEQPPPPQT